MYTFFYLINSLLFFILGYNDYLEYGLSLYSMLLLSMTVFCYYKITANYLKRIENEE
jgi:hypothetical protein